MRQIRLLTGTACVVVALAAAGPAQGAARTCTWAGTPAAPTGTFTVSPGVTNTPSAGPLRFVATGRLGGGAGCHGTVTFAGQLDAGATCPYSTFEGRVLGLPGVERYAGRGSLDVPSMLYDRAGRLVGVENANIMTQTNLVRTLDCSMPGGFRGGWPAMFSSVVRVF
jgi:hypothetical protein